MRQAINRRDILAALLLLLLPLLLFWPVTIGPYTLLPADNLFAHEPWLSYRDALGVGLPQNQLLSDLILENYVWKKFIREAIASRQIPLWNPYILSGQPFLANGQHSALYPFSLIFYLMPLAKAFGWFAVSQLWLAGLMMYLFLRTLRATRLGALVGGITYSLSAFFVVSVVFMMIIAAAVWLPLILAMIEMIVRKQEEKGAVGYSPIPYVITGAIALGLQTLAGHVEIVYYTLLVCGFYAVCRLLLLWRRQNSPRFALRLAGWLLLMILLGIGLGAVQLIPMYEVVTQNFRDNSVTLAQVRGWALPARRIITFLVPDFFGSPAHHGYFDIVTRSWQPLGLNAHGTVNPLCPYCTGWDTKTAVEAGAYVGILPLLLAGLAVIQACREWLTGRKSARDLPSPTNRTLFPTVLIFAGLAGLSLLFAFGTPLYAILFYGLPGWNQLHSPFRWIFPFTLGTAVLAGLGVTYLEILVSVRRSTGSPQHLAPEPGETTDSNELAANRSKPERSVSEESPSFLVRSLSPGLLSLYLGRLLFWGGLAGLLVLLVALLSPSPFIEAATLLFERSGLAQNAFADGRQLIGYQWPNFFKFFMIVTAAGALLQIVHRPIFAPPLKRNSRSRINLWKPLIVFIVALDLLLAGAGFNPAVDPALLEFKPEVVTWLEAQQAEDPFFRIDSFDTPTGRGNKVFLANAGMFSNLFDVRGYDSIIPAQYSRFVSLIQANGDLLFNRVGPLYFDGYTALDSALLDLLGVRYVLTTVDIANENYELAYDNEIRVFENLDSLPRAFMVFEEMPAGDDLGLALRSFNPRQYIILDGVNNGLGRDLAPDDAADLTGTVSLVDIDSYTPNEVRLAVQVDRPGWLVLADTYFPGWKAYARRRAPDEPRLPVGDQRLEVNRAELEVTDQGSGVDRSQAGPVTSPEIEVTIHRANGNFRAIYLQPGQWSVRFRYSPRSFQLGLYVSFLTLILLIFIAGYWTWGRLYREKDDDSPIKRIAKNSLLPMIMALTNRLIDFAFALLMLRILQPEGAGQYAFAVAFIGLAEIMIRFGLGTLVTRDTASNAADSNRYLSNVSVLRIYLWLAALPIMVAVLALYVAFGDLSIEVVLTVAIFAAGTFFSNLSDGITAIFYAREKAEYPAGVTGATTLTRVALGALVLILGWGIIGLALASFVANLVAFLVLAYILMTKIFRPRLELDPSLQRNMLGQGLPLMINHLLSTIFFRIDVFILEPTRGSTEVGYYSAAYKYIDGINVIPQYFTLAIFPLMSRFATNSRESLVRAYILSLRILLLLALPIAMGTPFVAHELILFLAGREFLPASAIVLQILIWFLPFSFINQVTQYVLIAINQQRQLTRAFIIGVLFNSITNLIFIPLYGYRAAAVTTILSEWALLIPFYLLVRKHLCTVPWIDVAWRPTVAAAAMGACLWLIGEVGFVTTILTGSSVYLIVLILVGGVSQKDMGIIWRVLPLGRLRSRLPWVSKLSQS